MKLEMQCKSRIQNGTDQRNIERVKLEQDLKARLQKMPCSLPLSILRSKTLVYF